MQFNNLIELEVVHGKAENEELAKRVLVQHYKSTSFTNRTIVYCNNFSFLFAPLFLIPDLYI